MRILLGPDPLTPARDDDELPPGAYDWPDSRPWTRVTMLRSLDGGVAGPDGRSGSISSAVDRQVLAAVRRHADAVVIGAATLRVERYGPMTATDEAAEDRRRHGQADAPVLVVVSGSLDLPWEEEVWAASSTTPIVVTGTAAPAAALERAAAHATVVQLDEVTAMAILDALHERGLRRVVCEGGPGLLAAFAREGVVDEICLTVAPYQPTLTPGADGDGHDPAAFELTQLVEHESFLFARYLRRPVGDAT